ncbi:MAG: LrgB family protein [Alphaproteobacteria bacterium]|nr:LrgB family protein [Alphaproteobacteria bacterium]
MTGSAVWIAATVLAYAAGLRVQAAARFHPLANPVLIACLLVGAAVELTGTPAEAYLSAAAPLLFLLGPATVALAVPIFRDRRHILTARLPFLVALAAGSLTAILSALVLAGMMGAERATLLSIAPKSATTPIAIGVAEAVGGLPSLAAAIVILTGILGALVALPLFRLLKVRDVRAQGFAIGLAAHGIGTAHAFQHSQALGAYAGLGLGLNGVLTALIAPLIVRLMS